MSRDQFRVVYRPPVDGDTVVLTRRIGDPIPRKRSRSALYVSLALHGIVALVFTVVLAMRVEVYQILDEIQVEWLKVPDAPKVVKKRLKTPIEKEKPKTPERPVAREAPEKLMKQANNPITEVARWSPKPLLRDAENNIAPRIERLPDLMTAADLKLTSDVTNLSAIRSLPGDTSGIGTVTGRARVKGSGLGSFLYGNEGTGNGLLGGGGASGTNDPLKILDFLRGRGEHGNIVYVLDVSGSMAAAGLYKLELAKQSLLDHLFLLSEEDSFNIVTFHATVARMSPQVLPATADNMTKAKRYLDKFQQDSILDNNGTNTLGALQAAFAMKPDVVVLLTDGVPTSAYGMVVETEPEKIVSGVRAANTNRAGLFIVGLELDVRDTPNAPGAILLKRLAEQTGGKIKFVNRDELAKFKERFASR
jgi:hypothetical protein